MANGHDLTGQVFSRLTAVAFAGNRGKKKERYWECLCECGKTHVVQAYSLRSGNTQSCGCLALEVRSTHKQSYSDEYHTWQAMKERCHNPNATKYYMYGARGITVCPSWVTSFENFFADMGNRPAKDYSIERLNGNEGYSKENCVWADKTAQANNTRLNRPITYLGEILNLGQWAKKFHIPVTTLLNRLDTRKMSLEDALTFKPFQRVKK